MKSYENPKIQANRNYIADVEYKIIAPFYKFSMPFIYKVMGNYAWHVNRYLSSNMNYVMIVLTLWLSLMRG